MGNLIEKNWSFNRVKERESGGGEKRIVRNCENLEKNEHTKEKGVERERNIQRVTQKRITSGKTNE